MSRGAGVGDWRSVGWPPGVTSRLWLLLLVAALALAGCQTAPTAVPSPTATTAPTPAPTAAPGALFVDAGQRLGTIPATVYGTNYGPWITVPVGVLEPFQQSGLTFLRFPGGAWGDENTIRDYQLDQLMAYAAMLDGGVTLSARLHGGTPEQAVALLQMARARGHNGDVVARHWSIGNEPSLYATTYQSPEWDTVYYNQVWREFALALKEADPDILLLGPDIHQFTGTPAQNPKDSAGRDWMIEFLRANGDLVDVVTIHRYPFPTSPSRPHVPVADLTANPAEWDQTIPYLRQLIQEHTGRELPIGVTEINSHWSRSAGGETTPDSFYNALWWGDVLGRLIRHRVEIVTHFVLQTRSQQGGWGLLERNSVRPTYYVYQLYQQFGQELVYSSTDQSRLTITAALRGEGEETLTLMITNLNPEPRRQRLQLVGFPADAKPLQAHGQRLRRPPEEGAPLLEQLAPQPLPADMMLTLPAESITLLIVSRVVE